MRPPSHRAVAACLSPATGVPLASCANVPRWPGAPALRCSLVPTQHSAWSCLSHSQSCAGAGDTDRNLICLSRACRQCERPADEGSSRARAQNPFNILARMERILLASNGKCHRYPRANPVLSPTQSHGSGPQTCLKFHLEVFRTWGVLGEAGTESG